MKMLLLTAAVLMLAPTPAHARPELPKKMQGAWCPSQPKNDLDNTHGSNWLRYSRAKGEGNRPDCDVIYSNGQLGSTEFCILTAVKPVEHSSFKSSITYEATVKCIGEGEGEVISSTCKRWYDLDDNGDLTISYEKRCGG
jgi:hypothetical protein